MLRRHRTCRLRFSASTCPIWASSAALVCSICAHHGIRLPLRLLIMTSRGPYSADTTALESLHYRCSGVTQALDTSAGEDDAAVCTGCLSRDAVQCAVTSDDRLITGILRATHWCCPSGMHAAACHVLEEGSTSFRHRMSCSVAPHWSGVGPDSDSSLDTVLRAQAGQGHALAVVCSCRLPSRAAGCESQERCTYGRRPASAFSSAAATRTAAAREDIVRHIMT